MTGTDPNSDAGPKRRTLLRAVGAGVAALGATQYGRPASASTAQDQMGIPRTLPSAVAVNESAGTVTLPMYRARGPDGGNVYYVLTESSDLGAALDLGLNWAPKLANGLGTPAVQEVATVGSGRFDPLDSRNRFAGTVDFSPDREVVPGPEGFPLDAEESQPGSVGDNTYSPLVTPVGSDVVFNAPHVENESGRHDALVERSRGASTATLRLVEGFYEGQVVLYISTDAYPADVAALEGATHAPTLAELPAPGQRDLESSAREPIVPVVNGPMGEDNPDRQGLRSAVAGEGSPLNVTRSEQVCETPADPTNCSVHYSPLWDVHPVVWTEAAVEEGRRRRVTDHEDILSLVVDGALASAADGPVNTEFGNVRAAVAAVNCPFITVEAGDRSEVERS